LLLGLSALRVSEGELTVYRDEGCDDDAGGDSTSGSGVGWAVGGWLATMVTGLSRPRHISKRSSMCMLPKVYLVKSGLVGFIVTAVSVLMKGGLRRLLLRIWVLSWWSGLGGSRFVRSETDVCVDVKVSRSGAVGVAGGVCECFASIRSRGNSCCLQLVTVSIHLQTLVTRADQRSESVIRCGRCVGIVASRRFVELYPPSSIHLSHAHSKPQ